MKQKIQLAVPKREFILHNPSMEPMHLGYGGETKTIPPCNQIVTPISNDPSSFGPGYDADGDPIPGTLCFADIYEPGKAGGTATLVWDAWEAVKHCLGVDHETGEATGPFARKGVSLVDADSTKEQIAEVAAAGRMRYEEFKVAEARATVAAHDEDNARRRRQGHPDIPGDANYEEALMILSRAVQRQKDKMSTLFGEVKPIQVIAPESGTTSKLPEPDMTEDAVKELVKSHVLDELKSRLEAGELKTQAEAGEIVDKALQDPRFMKEMRARFQMTKWREVERARKQA